VENYKLIYPNFDMEIYEKFMNTAKVVWEEFTGSGAQPKQVQKKDSNNSMIQQKIVKNKQIGVNLDEKDSIKPKRKRPSSAIPKFIRRGLF
jgi:hypothetical protein